MDKKTDFEQKIEKEIEHIDETLSVPENKMGVMNMRRLIWTMSLPAMISMLIQALYNIVDSIFVAMISEKTLAAVTLVFPVQMLLISFAVGTGVGLSSLIARRLGAKRYDEADSAASHGFLLAVLTWLLFAVFGLFLSEMYIRLFTQDAYIIEAATIYCKIVTIGSVFTFILINTEKILQATGNMVFPMIFNITGAIINIILDPILIFGWFGLPALGVKGAAIATIAGQFIAMLIGLIMLFAFKHHVHVKIRNFRLDLTTIKNIYSVGAPSIVMQAIGSFMITGLNAILISHSAAAVAVLGAYFRVQSFIFMPVFGLNQGTMPILAYNYGARNKERLLKGYKSALKIALVIMAAGTLSFHLFPAQILHMFSASAEMLEIGTDALRIISLCFIPASFIIITTAMFGALDHGMFSMFVSLLRQLLILLPLAWVLSEIWGINYVWFAFPLAEIFALILTLIFLRHIYKKEILPL